MKSIGIQLHEAWTAHTRGDLSAEQYVRLVYRLLLLRDVDPPSLKHYLELPSLEGLAKGIFTSHEFITRWTSHSIQRLTDSGPRRVLLFGAYGNGNLGDRMQPAVLRRLGRQLRPDLEFWACSTLIASFDYPFDRVLPPAALYELPLREYFDLLIVGGGGLLAHPHDPLTNPAWQEALDLPVALLGIGARDPVVGQSEPLVRRAFSVSGRDRTSLQVLGRYRDDVALIPDPVLCDSTLERAAPPGGGRGRILWILEAGLIDQCEPMLRHVDPAVDLICYLEPQLDAAVMLRWPDAVAIYSVEQLTALIDAADNVVSMRYHGTILAILRGTPVYAVCKDKSKELVERHGAAAAFSSDGADFDRRHSFRRVPQEHLRRERAAFLGHFAEVLSSL